MAKETKPKDITPIKRKGIDMAVKGASKSFPFIIGYKDDDSEQFDSAHYIDLIIDMNKLSEYMEEPINPYWLRMYGEEQKTYALWSFLEFKDNLLDDMDTHPGYILQKEIQELVEMIYEYLPEEYRLTYEYDSQWNNEMIIYPVRLKVNAYIHKLTR
jgi:hypothetical protein